MKHFPKKLLYVVFLLLVLAVVLYIGAKNGDLSASLQAILNIPPGYVVLCVLCTFGNQLMQAVSLKSALRTLGNRLRLKLSYAVTLLGSFYSYITPGASGGQPMQVYQLHDWHVPVGSSTAALTLSFQVFEVVLLVCDVVLFAVYRDFLLEKLGPNLPFLIVGFVVNALKVVGSLLISFYQKPIRWLLEKVTGLMRRFNIGNPDKLEALLSGLADGFYDGMKRLAASPAELARQSVIALAELILSMSVIFFLCRGLGQTAESYGRIVALGCMQYTSAAYTPLPGASGAQEGLFSLYFQTLLPGVKLLSALLAWRFITYYLVLIVGFFVTTALGMRDKDPEDVQKEIDKSDA